MGAGTFCRGAILTTDGNLDALYTRETEANEPDPEEQRLHRAWMECLGTKPGDVLGGAVDRQGRLFKFRSA